MDVIDCTIPDKWIFHAAVAWRERRSNTLMH
ncbi:hypothetical protein EMEDMD4_500077 [Sinorhizobium medicae]|uniref:Uncharacterized protein n=1 Tax=Sinorhizobium medicae TaxID=110321 RepID=A0A508X3L9_9HYPH|nr:hypothetical protein EMEDMD4_500077 [Sinorhizobium medicae]